MTLQIALLLAILLAALVLLSLERFSPDVVSLGVLLALVLTGLLPAEQAFAGYTSDAAILVLGLLIFTAALVHTGAVGMAGRLVGRLTRDRPRLLPRALTLAAAALSAFLSNTATTALLVPLTLNLARKAQVRPSRLLMPLAFAAILASSVTLVSSSTNIVIGDLIGSYGMRPLGVFELAPVGLPVAAAGLLYLWLAGERIIPQRGEPDEGPLTLGIRPYLVEAVVLPGSPLAGKTLAQSGLGRDFDLTVLRVLRRGNHYLAPRAGLRLDEGDELLLEGQRDEILCVRERVGIAVKAEVKLSHPDLQREELRLAEALVPPRSPLVGKSLKGVSFRQQTGLQVLGLSRRGTPIYRKLSQAPLRTGDQLLVQGAASSIAAADRDHMLLVVGPVDHSRPNLARAPVAAAIFLGVIAVMALGVLSPRVAVALGVLLVFATGCISPDQAYRAVSWQAVVVVGSMLALGRAMAHTGAAAYLAAQIAALGGQAPPAALLAAFFTLAMLLTQPMSNQAAAVVVVPVAVQTARRLGLNPRTFVAMIAVGASCSFITPLEPACLLVYGPGRYRFLDFVRAGAPLTLLVGGIALALVPVVWPL